MTKNKTISREDAEAFDAIDSNEWIEDLSVEVELDDGDYYEFTAFPAIRRSDERSDWLDFDWDSIERFPVIASELGLTLDIDAEVASSSAAQQRAESGYAQ